MKTNNFIIAVITAFLLALSTNGNAQNRIIGGSNATIEERPFQVSIQSPTGHMGGGVIIDKEWILTAAHIVEPYTSNPSYIWIKYGSTRLSYCTDAFVDTIIIHPEFHYINTSNGVDTENDLALIKLRQPISIADTHKPIDLATAVSYPSGTTAVLSGWGEIGGNHEISDWLKKADINISTCHGGTIESQASSISGNSGDSGGPLTYDGKLIGIQKSIKTYNSASIVTCFTNIGYYYHWINNWVVLSVSLNTPSFMLYGSTATITWNPSAPYESYTVSSNLRVVSATDRTITVQGIGTGMGRIEVVVNGRTYSSYINIGVPIISGVTYNNGYLYASMYGGATISRTEWVIGGNNYMAYDSFIWCQYSHGTVNVKVRAEVGGTWSDWYETQVNLDGNYMNYNIAVSNTSINILPSDDSMLLSCRDAESSGQLSYTIVNANTQEPAMNGQISTAGGTIHISALRNGSYVLHLRNGSHYKNFKFIK